MSKARILIVEDNAPTAELIQTQLQAVGYIAVGVATAATAIDLARAKSPDLVLLDIAVSGDMATARRLFSTLNIPVLYLTEQTDTAFFEHTKLTEPFTYLLKPINQRELILTIEIALYRHQLESQLKQSEIQLAEAQRIGQLGSWSKNPASDQLQCSDEIFRIFGLPVASDGLDYETMLGMVHPEDRQLVHAAVQNAHDFGKRFSIYHRIIQADGVSERVVHHTGKSARGKSTTAEIMAGMLQDVTEHKATEARLWDMAHHDPLCGLPNRLLLYDRLNHAITRAQRSKQQLALMLFDLDDFKTTNDNYGLQTGDSLLIEISTRLQRYARECDTVARLGGDEFTLIIEQLKEPRDAAVVAQKLLEAMQEPVCLDGRYIQVTCSLGIALYPDDATTLEELLKVADSAMFQAKRAGKNNFQFYIDAKRQTH